jgi:phosphoadenosine phosphosulfate reductase
MSPIGRHPVALPAARLDELDAGAVLDWAVASFGRDRLAIASSFGPEDIVLIDLLASFVPKARVFTLDTGRLPQETYDLMDQVRRRWAIDIEVFFPDAVAVETMTTTKGLNLFYESVENRRECCHVRKVEPLGRALATVDAWVTGLRRDQSATRAEVRKAEPDPSREGLWKIAPLVDWTSREVWAYIRERDLPYNALHDRGYPSIGCAPCSRAVEPGEDDRAGRWWWEQESARECGIHFDPRSGKMVRSRVPAAVPGPFDDQLPAGGAS